MDRAVAVVGLVLAAPAVGVRALRARRQTGRAFTSEMALGAHGEVFRLWRFADDDRDSPLLGLVAVAAGHMRVVGPRPLRGREATDASTLPTWRLHATPGLFSTHRLQQQTGIAYESEHDLDRELVTDQSLNSRSNLGLVARSLVAGALGGAPLTEAPRQLSLLDVRIVNTTMQDALDWIVARAAAPAPRPGEPADGCATVFFVNPGCLNIAMGNESYRAVLHDADMVLPDGIGIKLATRLQGVTLRENVNGTDMFPRLCERAAAAGLSLFLLGAREGVAEAAAASMRQRFPGLSVAGAEHGYFAGNDEAVLARINDSGANILLVAMGVPQQELWIAQMRDRLRPGVALGVGGLFDFYSGRIPRAPLWVREIGMEWVWRLAQEPGRMWRRYLVGNPLFLFRVWRDQPATRRYESQARLRAAAAAQAAASNRAIGAVLAAAGRRRPARSGRWHHDEPLGHAGQVRDQVEREAAEL